MQTSHRPPIGGGEDPAAGSSCSSRSCISATRSWLAFRLHHGKWLAIGAYKDADRARIEPFDAVEFDLAVLWADLPYPARASEPTTEWEYERSLPDY